jgi:hypothetical protein
MITKNTPLLEVFEKKPKIATELLLPVLGGGCANCPMAVQENLGEALIAHGLDVEEAERIIAQLNK